MLDGDSHGLPIQFSDLSFLFFVILHFAPFFVRSYLPLNKKKSIMFPPFLPVQ